MKLVSHDINTELAKMDSRHIDEVFEECMNILEDVSMLEEVLYEDRYMKMEGASLEHLDDVRLDMISMLDFNLKFNMLSDFNNGFLSGSKATLRRVKAGVHYLDLLESIVKEISEPYLPPTTKQVEDLREVTYHVLGEISYFTYYQFNLDLSKETLDNSKELEVNVSVKAYMDSTGKSIEDIISSVRKVMDSHKPNLTIFEAFPEIEEEFFSVVGVYLKDFESMEELITPDLVLKVVKGEIEPEVAVETLRALEMEESDSSSGSVSESTK